MQVQRTISRRDMLAWAPSTDMLELAPHCVSLHGTACRACEDSCPERAIRFRPTLGGLAEPVIDPQACTCCRECLPVCPVSALSLSEPGT